LGFGPSSEEERMTSKQGEQNKQARKPARDQSYFFRRFSVTNDMMCTSHLIDLFINSIAHFSDDNFHLYIASSLSGGCCLYFSLLS